MLKKIEKQILEFAKDTGLTSQHRQQFGEKNILKKCMNYQM